MDEREIAYLAGILDVMGNITTRRAGTTLLPQISVSTKDQRLLDWLGERTGVRAFTTRREFLRAGCNIHCKERHRHVLSESGRWSVSGAKATVVLAAVRPYLHLKAPRKPATATKMSDLGWPLPEGWTTRMKEERV